MSSLPQVRNDAEAALTCLNGPEKGAIFKLVGQQITLGRSQECNIVIASDPACSRQHARIDWTQQGFVVTALNTTNPPLINGQPVQQAIIQPGSTLTIGKTQFNFQFGAPSYPQPYDASKGQANGQVRIGSPRSDRPRTSKKKGNPIRVVFVAVIGILLWLLLSPDGNKKNASQIKTDEVTDKQIESLRKSVALREQDRQKTGKNSVQYQEAQTHYLRGFRDYQKGQFERAMVEFQACLALTPGHANCVKYMGLAQKKFDQMIQFHMEQGTKSSQNQQWESCMSSFRNAMVMMAKDQRKAKRYEEAKANLVNCESHLRDQF